MEIGVEERKNTSRRLLAPFPLYTLNLMACAVCRQGGALCEAPQHQGGRTTEVCLWGLTCPDAGVLWIGAPGAIKPLRLCPKVKEQNGDVQ